MASNRDLLVVINETLSVVKSIGKDVKALAEEVSSIKQRLNVMEKKRAEILPVVRRIERKVVGLEEILDDNESEGSSRGDVPLQPILFDTRVKGSGIDVVFNGTTAKIGYCYGNNGCGIVTNLPLRDKEIFEIRIDAVSNSTPDSVDPIFGIGVLYNKNEKLIRETKFITLYLEGTWGILSLDDSSPDGKSDRCRGTDIIQPGGYSLDTRILQVGTVLGMVRYGNGDLHFYLNGVDKGRAFKGVPRDVYAYVDLGNYVTQISVV